mgnify:CR=1 FL=1
MKKFIIFAISAMAFLPSQGMTQYAGAGTDYTKAASETWTEDAMNDFLGMANSFACISKNSRVDLLPNATYESLISEVQCGLSDLNSQGTNRDTLSRSVITSSRASNTSTQEGTNWFDSADGPKFIANMQFKKDPTTFGPYGEWYISYLMAKLGSTDFTTTNSPAIGFVDIRPGTGSSIVITSADRNRQGDENLVQRSKISYSDNTLNTATLLGEYKGKDENNSDVDIVVAGRTSETNYFRITTTTSGSSTTKVSQCLKRDQTWSNVYKYDVYNKSSGAKLALTGSFGFETAADTRGFYDHNGAWFDSSFVFNKSSKKIVAVTDNDSGTAYTLKWAPGKLYARGEATEALASGVNIYERNGMYVRLIGSTKTATYHTTLAGAFGDSDLINNPWGVSIGDDVTQSDIESSGNDHLGWMHDMTKRSMVYWAGGTTVEVQTRTPKSFDATLLAANFTTLTQDSDRGVKNMPADLNSWAANSRQDSRDYIEGSGGTADGAAFFFTGLNPTGVASGLLPRTLYIDTATGSGSVTGPDSLDKAVMYDFAVNQRTGEFEDFSDDSTGAFENKAANGEWPSYDIDLKDSGGAKYRWEFGAYPWDNSIAAIKADGTVKPVDQPVMLKYTHTTAGDVNAALANGLTYFANKDNYFPDKTGLCPPPLMADGNYLCVAKPSSFNGKTFMLEYNGSHLHGLPEQFATYSDGGSKGSYLKIVNPVDGSDVFGPDGTAYVLKAREVGKSFVPAPNSVYNPASPVYYDANVNSSLDCDDLSFDELSDLGSGWTTSDLPDVTDTTTYPYTTKTWADLPAANTLKCTVTMGKATGCQ